MNTNARTGFIALVLVGLLGAGIAGAQDQPPTSQPPSQATQPTTPALSKAELDALSKEIRTLIHETDREYTKCRRCAKWEKEERRYCPDCSGEGRVFKGDWNDLLERYLKLCELMDRCTPTLEAADPKDKSLQRFQDARTAYLLTIRSETGPQKKNRERLRAQEGVKYGRHELMDGQYNQLARRVTGTGATSPVGRGISITGEVLRIETKGDQSLAEIRIETVSFTSRTCWVRVPNNVTWKAGLPARVIGRVVAGDAERKAFGLDEGAAVIQPYHGTE